MNVEEQFSIPAPIERVWDFVRDPDRVGIPGCEQVEAISDTSYSGTIAVSLGPIKVRFVVLA